LYHIPSTHSSQPHIPLPFCSTTFYPYYTLHVTQILVHFSLPPHTHHEDGVCNVQQNTGIVSVHNLAETRKLKLYSTVNWLCVLLLWKGFIL
jgi:hypothetical protein